VAVSTDPQSAVFDADTIAAAAFALFKGDRQQEWIRWMLDHGCGLHPADGNTGRSGSSAATRILNLLDRLYWSGFTVDQRPIGPKGGNRYVLTAGPDPDLADARATARSVLNSLCYSNTAAAVDRHIDGFIALTAEQRKTAAVLAEDWPAEEGLATLLEVAAAV
jgi:hypothetical protein